VSNSEEARKLLDCLSLSLIRAIVAIAISDIKSSKDLSKAISTSVRNAQRIITSLEHLGVIKTITYGRKKVILSINKYVKAEVVKVIELLVPYIIDVINIPLFKLEEYTREILSTLMKILGLNIELNNNSVSLVKNVITKKELKKKVLPYWIKRIANVELAYNMRIGTESAKQPQWQSDIPYNVEVGKLVIY